MNLTLTPAQQRLARGLAAELALRGTDRSLISEALNYLRAYPKADFFAWLDGLKDLGELFVMSQQTVIYREELHAACQRLRPVEDNRVLAHILGWTARLHGYYWERVPLAREHAPLQPRPLRQGDILSGRVRSEVQRHTRRPAGLVVEIGPGQWARLSRGEAEAHGLAVGDQVEVEIGQVRSAWEFKAKILSVPQRRAKEPPAGKPKRVLSTESSTEQDYSSLVGDIMAKLQARSEEQEEED